MRFRLIPSEDRFFSIFNESAMNAAECARRLRDIVSDFTDLDEKHALVAACETRGDELREQLRQGELPLGPAVEMALVGRFYERLGDHALHITQRLGYAAGT